MSIFDHQTVLMHFTNLLHLRQNAHYAHISPLAGSRALLDPHVMRSLIYQ